MCPWQTSFGDQENVILVSGCANFQNKTLRKSSLSCLKKHQKSLTLRGKKQCLQQIHFCVFERNVRWGPGGFIYLLTVSWLKFRIKFLNGYVFNWSPVMWFASVPLLALKGMERKHLLLLIRFLVAKQNNG